MAKGTKKKSSEAALERELDSCRKAIDLMSIELQVYREIGGLAVNGTPKGVILDRLMDYAMKSTDASAGALFLTDSATRELSLEAVKGPAAKRHGLRSYSARSAAGLVARTKKPFVSAPGKKGGAPEGIAGGCIAIPLLSKRHVIGVIEVAGKAGGAAFTAADLGVLKSLANHFAIVMERADLFSELDRRIKQFSTLNEVGNLLISTLDHAVVRHQAIEAITRLMKAETGSLLLIDKKSKELYFEVALGEKGRKLKEIRLNIGEGIAGWVAKHGKPLLIHDVSLDKRFQGSFDRKSKFKTRNMVCVPVKIKGEIIGVIQAINSTAERFEREDLKLFQLFSNQVAIALDNSRLYEEIRETFYATSGALAEAIEKRDPYTGGHTKRVLGYCLAIARQMGLEQQTVEVLKLSAVLHDIGKIGIVDSILRKNGPLDPEEAAAMKMHPLVGAEIMKHVPQLKDVIPGVLHHHERMDGLGYPRGLKNEEIPLVARIITVADTYDAMTSTRPYRSELTAGMAVRELRKWSGRQFDGQVVNAFVRALKSGEIAGLAAPPAKRKPPGKKRPAQRTIARTK